jgi:hypothetical protein
MAGERESRFISYSVNYASKDELIAFTSRNCCQGSSCVPQTSCCGTTGKRRAKVAGKT